MTSKTCQRLLSEKSIAVVGVSRSDKKFGYTVYKELKSKGYNVYPVNPNTEYVDKEKCYPDLLSLPGKVEAALLVIKPSETVRVVRDAYTKGIRKSGCSKVRNQKKQSVIATKKVLRLFTMNAS
jgi:predicted CoA-binding protein